LIGTGWADDGYDWIAQAESEGWRAVSGWGRDGWDLGDWPYVVYCFRERVVDELQEDEIAVGQPHSSRVTVEGGTTGIGPRTLYERASYCEGDVEIRTYASAQDRSDDTDESALFCWIGNKESWVTALGLSRETTFEQIPEHLRGPYRRNRVAQNFITTCSECGARLEASVKVYLDNVTLVEETGELAGFDIASDRLGIELTLTCANDHDWTGGVAEGEDIPWPTAIAMFGHIWNTR
jgi:hypothetical protein